MNNSPQQTLERDRARTPRVRWSAATAVATAARTAASSGLTPTCSAAVRDAGHAKRSRL